MSPRRWQDDERLRRPVASGPPESRHAVCFPSFAAASGDGGREEIDMSDGEGEAPLAALDEPTSLGECPPGHDPTRFSSALEERMAAMRELLGRTRPETDAEALQTLRAAFPRSSLADRVRAVALGRGADRR
jgi:hypothetical protein